VGTAKGLDSLTVSDLTPSDLPLIAWSGSATHLESVTKALQRVASGEVDYLAVRAPDGQIVAKGGIDYKQHAEAPTMWQLATRTELQSLGIGTLLIQAMEDRIRARGFKRAMVGVEHNNPRAQALYERLGYKTCGTEHASWERLDKHGRRFLYETEVILLDKKL
jgi:ribosomal protein S18 acetylase RimI-like enzyme